ncbi:BA75_00981T0 [Komagataella pastoris]|uniref:BA75_00981T0 n=1 Tax=Komagataella pastoris TaxID=4922 RepID=A0A1B2J863_PICPA|nr:BA75_00981T0 [Komagataella pastoris]
MLDLSPFIYANAKMDMVKSAQDQIHNLLNNLCVWWDQITEEEKLRMVGCVSVGLLGLTFVACSLNKSTTDRKKHNKKKKRSGSKSKPEVKLTPYEFSETQIGDIMAKVSCEILPQLQDFLDEIKRITNSASDNKLDKPTKRGKKKSTPAKVVAGEALEQLEYKRRYFNEILLKELMDLDGVDTLGDVTLRDRRRECVRNIQGYHKELDGVKALLGDL